MPENFNAQEAIISPIESSFPAIREHPKQAQLRQSFESRSGEFLNALTAAVQGEGVDVSTIAQQNSDVRARIVRESGFDDHAERGRNSKGVLQLTDAPFDDMLYNQKWGRWEKFISLFARIADHGEFQSQQLPQHLATLISLARSGVNTPQQRKEWNAAIEKSRDNVFDEKTNLIIAQVYNQFLYEQVKLPERSPARRISAAVNRILSNERAMTGRGGVIQLLSAKGYIVSRPQIVTFLKSLKTAAQNPQDPTNEVLLRRFVSQQKYNGNGDIEHGNIPHKDLYAVSVLMSGDLERSRDQQTAQQNDELRARHEWIALLRNEEAFAGAPYDIPDFDTLY